MLAREQFRLARMNFSGRATGAKVHAAAAPCTRGNGVAPLQGPLVVPRVLLPTPQKPRQVRFADEATVFVIASREDTEDDADNLLEEMDNTAADVTIVHGAPEDDVLSSDDDDDSEDEEEVRELVTPNGGVLDMVSLPKVTLTQLPYVPVRSSSHFVSLPPPDS